MTVLPQSGPIQHTSMSFPPTFFNAIGFPQCIGPAWLVPHFSHVKVTALGQSAGIFIGFFIIGIHLNFHILGLIFQNYQAFLHLLQAFSIMVIGFP